MALKPVKLCYEQAREICRKPNHMTEIAVANMTLGNHRPMSLIGGMNVIESRDLVMRVAEAFVHGHG